MVGRVRSPAEADATMPVVTVEDITVRPRVSVPDSTLVRLRMARSDTTAPRGFEGEGFPVRRASAGVGLADLNLFIHLDPMGEVDYYHPGEPTGTPWHPHGGCETVTSTTIPSVAGSSPTTTHSA